jgi:hypothetical protein
MSPQGRSGGWGGYEQTEAKLTLKVGCIPLLAVKASFCEINPFENGNPCETLVFVISIAITGKIRIYTECIKQY